MDVKPGYKQTEAGVIPEDWDAKPLAGLAAIIHGFGFKSQYFKPLGNYRLTTPGHFYETGGFRDVGDKQKFYDGPLPDGYLLSEGDLLVAMTEQADGLLGSAAFVPTSGTYLHNQRLGKIKVLSTEVSIRFLYRVFNSKSYRTKVRETAVGTKVKHTSPSKLLEISIPLPPTKAEQEAIAAALSNVDALIAALDLLIAKKRDIKQAAMQELLTGKRRLPGFSGEWVMKRLGDSSILKARIGWQGLTTAEYLDSGDYYLVTGTEFRDAYIDWSSCHFVDESRYKQDKNIQLKEHDVLVTKDGTIGKVALISSLPKPATLNSGVFVIRPIDNAFHPDFFYYLLCSNSFIEFLTQLSAGSTINHLYQKDFVSFTYKTPAAIGEQIAIAAILSDMDAEIAALEARREKTRALKQGMMQELLTGRIRLA